MELASMFVERRCKSGFTPEETRVLRTHDPPRHATQARPTIDRVPLLPVRIKIANRLLWGRHQQGNKGLLGSTIHILM